MENVIWQFAKFAREQFIADHPDQPISTSLAAVAAFVALRDNGDAVEEVDAAGNITWRATPKFLRASGLESGPLVTFGPGVH
jgi:hypothetical protein